MVNAGKACRHMSWFSLSKTATRSAPPLTDFMRSEETLTSNIGHRRRLWPRTHIAPSSSLPPTKSISSETEPSWNKVRTTSNYGLKFEFHRRLYSFIYLFIHSFIHSFIYSSIHPFIHLFIHSFIHSFIHTFIHSSIYSFIHSFIHSFRSPARRIRITSKI